MTKWIVRATINGRRIESDPFDSYSKAVGYAEATRMHRRNSRPTVVKFKPKKK